MNTFTSQASYPFGLVLFAMLLAVYKAVGLITTMESDWLSLVLLIGLDSVFLAFLFMLALFQALLHLNSLRFLLVVPLAFLTFYYLVDSFVLLAINEHINLFEILRYTPERGVVLSFFNTAAYTAILLFLVSMLLFLKATSAVRKAALLLFLSTSLLAAMATIYAPRLLRDYAIVNPMNLLEGMEAGEPLVAYSDKEIAFYSGFRRATASIPASRPNIILLVIESLSSINSQKTSGLPGFLDGFDELSEEGVLFTNFFANHQASEGGLIALLGGFQPIHYPTATPYMFDEFAIQASVIAQYRKQGYFTEFLTNADLAFIGLDHFLNGLGVERSRGRDEVESMRTAPRIVQDAPSDTYLYQEALMSVRTLMTSQQPFVLTIATTSTHLPYTHPDGGVDSPEAVWEWSTQQLQTFYSRLSKNGYFENGVLLITGDHRQMRPLSGAEIERYGGSARARVPLLVIGEAYPHGQIDERFFQQSDLLRMLGKIDRAKERLSPHPVWVERYNRKYGRIELISNLSVFDEADQGRREYRLKVPGNHLEWLDEKPVFARSVEMTVHGQRSLHQKTRNALNHGLVENQ